MRFNAVKILEISITNDSKKEILEYLRKYLFGPAKTTQKTLTIATPNTEQLVYAVHHPWFGDILNKVDLTLPDSIGVVWAGRFLRNVDHIARIPGVAFMEDLVGEAAKQRVPIALIGGRDGVAVKALERLRRTYSGVSGWAEEPGRLHIRVKGANVSKVSPGLSLDTSDAADTFDTYIQMVARKIVDTRVQLVFIALGPPKQELFMEALKEEIAASSKRTPRNDKPIILMVVGGSFDEISGRIPAAPGWVSAIGMKWLWRLVLEPWRIRRQLALVEFVFLVFKTKLLG